MAAAHHDETIHLPEHVFHRGTGVVGSCAAPVSTGRVGIRMEGRPRKI